MKILKTCLSLGITLLLLLSAFTVNVSAAEGFDEYHCLYLATDPGTTYAGARYYKDGVQQSLDTMTWVEDATRGMVLSLDGNSEYLELGSSSLNMTELTFSTWINFRGTVDEANPAGAYWQRLFTLYQNENCYLSMSPHAVNPTLADENGYSLNGVYMEFYRNGDGALVDDRIYTPTQADVSHFGLPQDEWHHVAIVIDAHFMLKLYIDGHLIFDEVFGVPVSQMYANGLLIGKGIWDDPTLNALIDDTMLFDKALSAEQVTALMQTSKVAASQEDPLSLITTSTIYMPTTTAVTVQDFNTTEFPDDKPDNPFGLPTWGFAVCAGLLALIIILTVIVNMYEVSWRKAGAAAKKAAQARKEDSEAPIADKKQTKAEKKAAKKAVKGFGHNDADADEGEEPKLSIKQAALKKRREEHERFLEEERLEQEAAAQQEEDGNDD